MSAETRLVQVEIFGQTYRLRSEDDADYVESLAAVVDQKMRDIARETNAVDSLKVAVLAALNIVDESRRGAGGAPESAAPRESPEKTAAVVERVQGLVSILDEAISA